MPRVVGGLVLLGFILVANADYTIVKKEEVVEKHEAFRAKIRSGNVAGFPKPKVMETLQWSDELAEKARKYAKKCKRHAQKTKARATKNFPVVGQNIHWGVGGFGGAFPFWARQMHHYNFKKNSCNGLYCDFFKNIVGGKAKYIGCAVHMCETELFFGFTMSETVTVCNYAPGFGIKGRPYEVAETDEKPDTKPDVKPEGIPEVARIFLLKEHNRIRREIKAGQFMGQPAAKSMPPLKWDKRLEKTAQKQANTCAMKHGPKEERKEKEWWWVGQNLYMGSSYKPGVARWAAEARFYNHADNKCNKTCGHYTQVAWAETKYVGCGFTKCKGGMLVLACNYGPGGNLNRARPYVAVTEESNA